MKVEIAPTIIFISACGSLVYAVNHLHPDCVPGRDLCEQRGPHFKEGHEEAPRPGNTNGSLLQSMMSSTMTSSASLSLNSFSPDFLDTLNELAKK